MDIAVRAPQIFKKLIKEFKEFRKRRVGYRYYLSDVKFVGNSQIKLQIVIQGVRKQICSFSPDEILNDDLLLSEFSSIDVRTITYLAFNKYFQIKEEISIIKQIIQDGKTWFVLSGEDNQIISARLLYQNYDLLMKLSKKEVKSKFCCKFPFIQPIESVS